MANDPPPHVAAAKKIYDDWQKSQLGVASPQQPRPESAAERFKRARDIDQSKMPPWRNPKDAA